MEFKIESVSRVFLPTLPMNTNIFKDDEITL